MGDSKFGRFGEPPISGTSIYMYIICKYILILYNSHAHFIPILMDPQGGGGQWGERPTSLSHPILGSIKTLITKSTQFDLG